MKKRRALQEGGWPGKAGSGQDLDSCIFQETLRKPRAFQGCEKQDLISPMAWSRNQEQVALVLSRGYCPLSIFRKVTWLILESWAK